MNIGCFNFESGKPCGRVIKDFKKKGTLLNDRAKARIHGGSSKLRVRKKSNTLKIRRKVYNPKNPGDLI